MTPSSWSTRALVECGRLLSGGTPSKKNASYWGGDIPWFSSKEMRSFELTESELRVTAAGAQNGTNLVPPGTVMFVVRGMSLAKEFRVGVTSVPATFNQDVKALVPSDDVDGRYLARCLRWLEPRVLAATEASSHGTKRLSGQVFERLEIPLPPLNEQRRIADILDKADAIRRRRRETIALTEDLLRSAFLEMFGDPVTNPKGWEVRGLREVCSPKQWPTIAASELSGSGYPVFGANGVIGYHSEMNHPEPTVLITCRGATCGTINVCLPNSYVTGNAMALDDPDRAIVTREYLEWVLRLRGLADAITGSAQPQITRQSLQKVSFPVPPVNLQQVFGKVLEKNFVLRGRCEHAAAESEALFSALVGRAFAGSLEVAC